MPRKQLAIIIPSLEGGGQERVISILSNYLPKDEYEITIITLLSANPFYNIDFSTVKLIELKSKRVLFSFFKLFKTLANLKPNVVLSTSTHGNILTAFISLILPVNAKYIARESSIPSQNNLNSKAPRFFNFLIKKLYPKFDKIICQSEVMKKDLIENYNLNPEIMTVINNPLDIQPIENTEVMFERKSKGLILVSVGRLSSEKGHLRLLEILAKLSRPFTYYIVGDGPLKSDILQKVKQLSLTEKVKLLGRTTNVQAILKQSDLYLFGSYYEGFPNAVIEALQAGLPIIGFKGIGGQEEIIDDPKLGQLTDISTHLVKLLNDFNKLDYDTNFICSKAAERYHPNVIVDKYLKVFN